MKMKIAFNNMQLNNTPLERLVFDSHNVGDQYILLDDVNEKRWEVRIKVFQMLKITPVEYSGLNFFKGGNFPNDCFEEKKGYPVPQFQARIMEVQDSEWVKELKKSLKNDSENVGYMDKARHFLIPCYDNIIEIIAWDLELIEAEHNH